MTLGDAYETILVDEDEHILTIRLNRPQVLNAFDDKMCDEFASVWREARLDDEIRVVILTAVPGRAFSTGVDRKSGLELSENVWTHEDPGQRLGPKANRVWKPLICAIHGMCAGGAFYWVNEADIVICADNATFFDPHVSYGMVSALEPVGLCRRIGFGEVMRWALMGLDERMSAKRALEIGLVSEVVPLEELGPRARSLAEKVAAKPPSAIQGTVKAVWEGVELSRDQARMVGAHYAMIGNRLSEQAFSSGPRPDWELR